MNVRGIPLSACNCLSTLPAKMCAFNSHMQPGLPDHFKFFQGRLFQ